MLDRGQDIRGVHVSERQVVRRGQDLAAILLNTVTLVAATSALVLPDTPETVEGAALLTALWCWAAFRLVTRSRAPFFRIADYGYVLVVAATMPWFDANPNVVYSSSIPQVIAGTAVIALTMSNPPRVSFPATVLLTAAYAFGCAQLVGWREALHVPMLYYMLAIEWAITAALLGAGLAVARQVDKARAENHDAALRDAISAAVRDYELEHLALVHDTAASTLYLVGEGAEISPDRIAVQARRDLALLTGGPAATEHLPDIDIVAAIGKEIAHLPIDVEISGLPVLVLPGATARAVVAVVREALNNAERHARATRIEIDITDSAVTVTDDGVGFDPSTTAMGHGVAESIVARMRRANGSATVLSAPDSGTVVTLSWAPQPDADTPAAAIDDFGNLTERILIQFGFGIVVFALVQLVVTVPYAAAHTHHALTQIGLGTIAAFTAIGGVPRILNRGPDLTVLAMITMALIALVQGLLLPTHMLGGPAQWPLGATGLCLLPYLLRWRIKYAVTVIVTFWLGIAILNFVREPGMEMAFTMALFTAGFVLVQAFALAFPELLRNSAVEAADEIRERWALADRHRIAEALHDDYVRRTSKLIRGVFPLLQTLSTGVIDAETRRRARIESRRLRLYIFQSRTFSHPLVAELRPAIGDADRRGVVVTINADSDLPQLDEHQRRRVLTPVREALSQSSERARIGLTVAAGELIVSIICDAVNPALAPATEDDLRVEVTVIAGTVWVSTHLCLAAPTSENATHQHSIA